MYIACITCFNESTLFDEGMQKKKKQQSWLEKLWPSFFNFNCLGFLHLIVLYFICGFGFMCSFEQSEIVTSIT